MIKFNASRSFNNLTEKICLADKETIEKNKEHWTQELKDRADACEKELRQNEAEKTSSFNIEDVISSMRKIELRCEAKLYDPQKYNMRVFVLPQFCKLSHGAFTKKKKKRKKSHENKTV